MSVFDAVILGNSPHCPESASVVLLGLTLVERGRRLALKVGARRVYVIDRDALDARGLAAWETERGDAALLLIRAGDQLVHRPLVEPLLKGTSTRRVAVGPDGYAGAIWASGADAASMIAAIAADSTRGDIELASRWQDAERISHGDIARHPATTRAEQRGAVKMLLRILVKQDEDSPVSKYIYRPLSQPLTRALLHTPITANQVSYIVGVIGLVGCWFTALPGRDNLILGAALVFISGIIDGCDGEISRLKLTSSSFGAWLDTVVDETTQIAYFIAIGYHTAAEYPWVAWTVVGGALCYVATVYAIYYFSIVVAKQGGSQYYVGDLEIVDTESGAALRARHKPSTMPPWVQKVGGVLMLLIRRDFVNMAALAVTIVNGYAVIYFGILSGVAITTAIIVPEHLRLRRQVREIARQGGRPRLV